MSADRRSDREAELAVLAACVHSRIARDEARKHLVATDFDEPAHEAIWSAMAHLDRTGAGVDPAMLLSEVGVGSPAARLLPDLITWPAVPDHVADYAKVVRGWGIRRRLHAEAVHTMATALNPDVDAAALSATIAGRFAALRDSGISGDAQAVTLGELLDEADDEPDWLIPGVLERRDRLILTGSEGLGKSHLLRQIAILAAAGLHTWTTERIEPVKVLIVDCENSPNQVRRQSRALAAFAAHHGQSPRDRVLITNPGRIDIVRDRDLAVIHREMDALQPDLVVIGPLYRLIPRAVQTDDDAAPLLAALDTIRDRGAALLTEAHAGHALGAGGTRDMRPRGSSALLGWPEFGFGLRDIGTKGYCDFVAWRGQRSEREWPQRLRRTTDGSARWLPHEDTTDYSHIGRTA